MKLVSSGNQQCQHPMYSADGTVTAGGTAQLVLARSMARSFLKLQNLSNGPLYFEFGSARATATLTSGAVTGLTITNAGFGFSKPPVVEMLGGGAAGNSTYLGLGQPNGTSPSNPAFVTAVLTTGAVSSFQISNPGSGYVTAPYVFIRNSDLDPNGCAIPSVTSGMLLAANSPPYILNGTCCTTDSVAVFGATTGQAYLCRWMD